MLERVLGDGLRDLLRERAEDGLLRASILDFKPKLANRCKIFPVYCHLRASILDFRARLANRCRDFSVYPLFRALILNFKPKLANRCRVLPIYTIFRASILDFKPRLGNRCSTIVVAVENGPPATAVAATIFRVRFKFLCSKEEWTAYSGRSGNEFRVRSIFRSGKEELSIFLYNISQHFSTHFMRSDIHFSNKIST